MDAPASTGFSWSHCLRTSLLDVGKDEELRRRSLGTRCGEVPRIVVHLSRSAAYRSTTSRPATSIDCCKCMATNAASTPSPGLASRNRALSVLSKALTPEIGRASCRERVCQYV